MKHALNQLMVLITFMSVVTTLHSAHAVRKAPHFNSQQLASIMSIARRIHALNPRLDDTKYMEYATGIFKASRKYAIDENILIAIAQRETEFREGLPEGAAGEIGICQIRKMWLKNKHFMKEFKVQTIADLEKPSKNFLFAAWILRDLKNTVSKGSLPYWSFYNAQKFEPRFRYFLGVNRNIATLLRHEIAQSEGSEIAEVALNEKRSSEMVVEKETPKPAPVTKSRPVAPKFREVAAETQRQPTLDKAVFSQDVQDLVIEGSRWIPDALRRIQKQKEEKKQDRFKNAYEPSFVKQIAQN